MRNAIQRERRDQDNKTSDPTEKKGECLRAAIVGPFFNELRRRALDSARALYKIAV